MFRTADLAWSKSGNRRTALGLGRVRFEVGLRDIGRGPPINRATMVSLPQLLYGLAVARAQSEGRESGGAIANRGRLCIGLIDVKALFRGRSLLRRIHAPLQILESRVRTQGIYQRVFEVEIEIALLVSLLQPPHRLVLLI